MLSHTAAITDLRFEHLAAANGGALGIGVASPRLSWIVAAAAGDWQQAGYEVAALRPNGVLRGRTGPVASSESVLVPWPFAPLIARERALVRVRAWAADGRATAWSEPAPVEAGLLAPGDWAGCFITPDWDEDASRPQPCPLLRRAFTVRSGGVRQARL